MNNVKTVKRTYVSKKTGKLVTKTYTYDSTKYKKPTKRNVGINRTKATTYVFKSGKYTKAYYKEWERIKKESGSFEAQRFKETIDWLKGRERNRKITNLSVNAVSSSYAIEIFLDNYGYDPYDFATIVASELGYSYEIPVEYVLTESNWYDWNSITKKEGYAIFTAPNGERVRVDYDYFSGLKITEI